MRSDMHAVHSFSLIADTPHDENAGVHNSLLYSVMSPGATRTPEARTLSAVPCS